MHVETASGLFLGDRTFQQDAVRTFSGRDTGTYVLCLSDGIGGVGHGHLASRLIVRTASENLQAHLSDIELGKDIPGILHRAALAANGAVARVVTAQPDKKGMGGTLLLAVIRQRKLYYLSIGDSLIYRLRKGTLERLNQLHSLAASADHLLAAGRMTSPAMQSAAASSTLTSALTGQDLQKIDLPKEGMNWITDDILLLASDGIETLPEEDVMRAASVAPAKGAAAAVSALISKVETLGVVGQDNVSAIIAVG